MNVTAAAVITAAAQATCAAFSVSTPNAVTATAEASCVFGIQIPYAASVLATAEATCSPSSITFQPVNMHTAFLQALAAFGIQCEKSASPGAKTAAVNAINYGLQEFFQYARAADYTVLRKTIFYSSKITAEKNVARHGEDLSYLAYDGADDTMMVTGAVFTVTFDGTTRRIDLRLAGDTESWTDTPSFGVTTIQEYLIEDNGTNGAIGDVSSPAACQMPAFYSVLNLPASTTRNTIRIFPKPADTYAWEDPLVLDAEWSLQVSYIPFPEQVTQDDVNNRRTFPVTTKSIDLHLMPMILHAALGTVHFDHTGNPGLAGIIKERYDRAVAFMAGATDVANEQSE